MTSIYHSNVCYVPRMSPFCLLAYDKRMERKIGEITLNGRWAWLAVHHDTARDGCFEYLRQAMEWMACREDEVLHVVDLANTPSDMED